MSGLSLATFSAGMSIGLAVAAPIGPMGVLCIQRTLGSGLSAGLATGLGAATVHLIFGAIATMSLGAAVSAWAGADTRGLSLVSAGLLFWFALRILRRATVVETACPRRERWLQLYGTAFAFGLSNPVTILLFAAMLPAMTGRSHLDAAPLLVTGIFLGSIMWWTVLSTAIALTRAHLSASLIATMNKGMSVTLALFGTFTIANAFGLRLP
jgi:threonine/homoserine/homoserine lactone efflux protein